jgi:hypothetical protein
MERRAWGSRGRLGGVGVDATAEGAAPAKWLLGSCARFFGEGPDAGLPALAVLAGPPPSRAV